MVSDVKKKMVVVEVWGGGRGIKKGEVKGQSKEGRKRGGEGEEGVHAAGWQILYRSGSNFSID